MSRKLPAYIWVSTGPRCQGHMAPVPTACPLCGRKVIRVGNASNRQAYCEGYPNQRQEGGRWVRECEWQVSVFSCEKLPTASPVYPDDFTEEW
jgi:hypothetical protein